MSTDSPHACTHTHKCAFSLWTRLLSQACVSACASNRTSGVYTRSCKRQEKRPAILLDVRDHNPPFVITAASTTIANPSSSTYPAHTDVDAELHTMPLDYFSSFSSVSLIPKKSPPHRVSSQLGGLLHFVGDRSNHLVHAMASHPAMHCVDGANILHF